MPFAPWSRRQKSWGQRECPDILVGDLLSQGQLLLPLFFWEVLNQGMLTSNVLWHGYNQAQGLCRKISTYNYKGLSANLQVPCFISNHCSETQWCGIWCLWIRAHVSSLPSENLAVVILLLPVWLGEGLGQVLCTQAWRRQWLESLSIMQDYCSLG